MADEENTGVSPEDQEDQTEEGEEEALNDSSGAEDDSQDEGDDSGESDDEEEEEDDDGEEPPVRKTDKSYYIGLRHGKKAAQQQNSSQDDGGDDDTDDGNDLQAEIRKAIDPITKKLAEKEDEEALQNYVRDNPHAKAFEKKIRRYMAHPSRQHLPVETVALEAIGAKKLMQLGAQQAGKANSRANKRKGGGNSVRNAPKGSSVWNESPEEFEARQRRVREKSRG